MTTDLFNILSKNQFPLSMWVWIIIIIIATVGTNIDITIN